jgi:hypothetical protein
MAVPVAVCGQHSKLNCQRLKKPVTELLELKALTPPSQTCNGIPALRDSITVDNRAYHYLSRFEIAGAKRIYQHLSGPTICKTYSPITAVTQIVDDTVFG